MLANRKLLRFQSSVIQAASVAVCRRSQKPAHLRPKLPGHAPCSADNAVTNQHKQEGSRTRLRPSYTILIADDHPIVREGLSALLNQQPDMRVVAEARNGQEAMSKFFSERPDVALLDLRMPVMDGVEVVSAILAKVPDARVIILTTYPSEEDIYRSVQAGALGYVLKEAATSELVECIRAVGNGRTWLPYGIAAKLARHVASRSLTPRETDVLHGMVAGKSNKEIATRLNISEGTVKVHVSHILTKLKASGRTEAINHAIKRGLVLLDSSSE
jgi:two-component system, NarL family, response regulator